MAGQGRPREEEPDADSAASAAGKTQPATCFCPLALRRAPGEGRGTAPGLEVCPDKDLTTSAGKAKAEGVPWSCGVTRQALKVILPGSDAPAHVPPCPSQAPAVYDLSFQLPSVHIYPVASVTPALVPFTESPFGDPAALWMPVTQS